MSDQTLGELLDLYFDIGVAEGREGRNHDRRDGAAQETRYKIAGAIARTREEAARDAANADDEAYEIGKRDGYSEAVQQIDRLTGGDGEYRYCTDHDRDRHTPGPVEMIQRIVDRFETLNLLEEATKTGSDQPDDDPAEIRLDAVEELREAAVMIRTWIPVSFPANEHGQVHFVRAVVEAVADTIERAINPAPTGTKKGQADE